MFSLKSRRKKNEVNAFMRRLVDSTTPAFRHEIEELRSEQRANRSVPVLIVPVVEDEPDPHGIRRDEGSFEQRHGRFVTASHFVRGGDRRRLEQSML